MESLVLVGMKAVLAFGMLAGWVIGLAGVGRLTDMCYDGGSDRRVQAENWAPIKNTNRATDCAWYLAFDWWCISLQFFTLVYAIVAMFTRVNRGVVAFIMTISTLQLTFQANNFVTTYRHIDVPITGALYRTFGQALNATITGLVLQLVLNYTWFLSFIQFTVFEAPEKKA